MRRKNSGQSSIELCVGVLILVPILFLVIDGVFVVVAQRTNVAVAQSAARTAANKLDSQVARAAADYVVRQFKPQGGIASIALKQVDYDPIKKIVSVETSMQVLLPIPMPGVGDIRLEGREVQPVLGISSL